MDQANQTTITVAYTVTLKPEPEINAVQKNDTVKQDILDQAAALVSRYDWGIGIQGSLTSDQSGTELLDQAKPDYEG